MDFNQIETSIESSIIGTKKENYQVIIDKSSIDKNEYQELLHLRLYNSDTIERLKKMNLSKLKGHLVKNAKFTDVMQFSPFIMPSKLIVSEKFIKGIKGFGVNDDVYFIKEIKIENAKQKFYLFFIPTIEFKYINFKQSKIGRSLLLGAKTLEYFNLNNFQDYQNVSQKHTFLNFDLLAIDTKYISSHILQIEGTSMCFFSNELFNYLKEYNITNLYLTKEFRRNGFRAVEIKII